MSVRFRITVILIATVVAVVLALAVGAFLDARRDTRQQASRSSDGMPALIGGPFELVAHTGETVTDRTYRGKFMLVFFGYTYCPDICPVELQVIADALDILGPKAEAIQPIFISVDPERDTPKVLADYVAAFHPRLVGLAGTKQQVTAAAKAYRAVFYKARDTSESSDGKDDGDDTDYLMNHTSYTYLMGPDGKYIRHFSTRPQAEEIAKALAEKIDNWSTGKES